MNTRALDLFSFPVSRQIAVHLISAMTFMWGGSTHELALILTANEACNDARQARLPAM